MFNTRYDISKDYFALLGVHHQACEKTIKQAYRKMARRYHPDVSRIHNATEKFQEIAEAYEVLTRFRDAYWRDFCRVKGRGQSHRSDTEGAGYANRRSARGTHQYTNPGWKRQKPIRGKDRVITYPLTLRYAIRLLKLGYFYIPGLKVKMKFTREAFLNKTFRLKGKGYHGLFGGEPGDYLVKFNLKLESINWRLEGSDIYGTIEVPSTLLVPGAELSLQSPAGCMNVLVPDDYSPDEYIVVHNMGLPGDGVYKPGHLYARLIAA
ncbi:molecular chaperone DnaJ [Hydrogenovibrio sp. SC-1]|uniref:DnaJ domain-containing protein n=1 Tax=Hydrogenovibrio sp. SC-1 TaxID=2065820 RepID=UPI000C79C05F|nr:DnaJ domain-containing protein [Hydrogenovibrio sp. SC-1]PLA73622.1 molecular chaperone DnaJ [Hydrogenovibrio sp. SC-1]